MKKHFFVTVALLFALLPAAAIGPKLGLQARVGVNISDFNTNTDGLSLSSRMGFHGAVAVPLTFGAIGVQPELMYIRNTMKISGEKIKMSNVKFPVLFSLRLLCLQHSARAEAIYMVLTDLPIRSATGLPP